MRNEVIAVVNQKGGVGKTTTAVNLATALTTIDQKILLIDLDPQGSASTSLGFDKTERAYGMYDLLINHAPLEAVIKKTKIPNLDVITAEVDLAGGEVELLELENREYMVKNLLTQLRSKYTKIIIDCAPSLSILVVNALVAADSVLIPLQCEFLAMEGLSHLLHTIQLVQQNLNKKLEIKGILLTMYDRRNRLTIEVEKDVREVLGNLVFKTVIPRNTKVSEAPSHGIPAIIYNHRGPGAMAYIDLAREIIEQEELIYEY